MAILGGSVGVVLIAAALVVNVQEVTSNRVKVTGESGMKIPKSIDHDGKLGQNVIHRDGHFVDHKTRDMQSRIDYNDDTTDYNETDFHSIPGKPSKFDRDVTELIHTDLKSMHESEAERLRAELEAGKAVALTNTPLVGATSTGASDDNWNSTRRMDNSSHEEIGESTDACNKTLSMDCLVQRMEHLLDEMSNVEVYNVTSFAQIVSNPRSLTRVVGTPGNSLIDKLTRYANEHILKIRMPSDLSIPRGSRTFFGAIFQGKTSFLTGFGLGFLAFGLKNLMLPFFIGMQIVKGVLVALFLPSIIGGIGKIFGKGLSTFSQVSQGAAAQPEENFEFKDNPDIYNEDYMHNQPIGTLPASAMYGDQYGAGTGTNQRVSYVNSMSDNYYSRNTMQGVSKRKDYKVFHEIPTSSLLLTNYDPFYSPLLSRLDAVFSRLGHSTEGCREYAICAMYRSPARYAPYSNLVSAQLSRELNELRKPTSDNPDVLRFFKYMKAAKDGQDGVQCEDIYAECAGRGNAYGENQAMLATYQDINKLVQARHA